ncbi:LysR family transcriptional regulator [Undibacterium sp.]|uniref:LysR family transcriptional regulator n=1 Tax=Undibacterium sp. TaxID=1914977 RepID=UPI00374CAB3F
MDHLNLDIFCSVAAELSITRAAQRLGRAQSNVTTRIQQLEEELGVPLFLRDNKRMRLTAQGETFLAYAKNLLALAEEARQVLHPKEPEGILRLGSMESTAASRLPDVLAHYHRTWPKVKLRLSTAPSRQLLDAVLNRSIDCALLALDPASDVEGPANLSELGLGSATVFREELLLLLPADHPRVHRPEDVQIRSLAAFQQGCTYRAVAEDWLAEAGNHAGELDIQEVGSYHAKLACVASGACISAMPRSVLELVSKPPALHQIPIASIDTLLVWRQGYETPAFQALRDLLSHAAASAQET